MIEPVDVRLAKYILAHLKNSYFNCKLTTSATTLNVSYRHLTRLKTQFKKEGLIQKEQQEYLI
ncbi:cyclic nucleotide-binding protein, partial [Enterococcus faecalis]